MPPTAPSLSNIAAVRSASARPPRAPPFATELGLAHGLPGAPVEHERHPADSLRPR